MSIAVRLYEALTLLFPKRCCDATTPRDGPAAPLHPVRRPGFAA